MKIICATKAIVLILMLLSIAYALPCGADTSKEIHIESELYGPAWDIVHDGYIDLLDVSSLTGHYGERDGGGWIRDDITKDGMVGISDVSSLVNHYGTTWLVP